MKHPHCSTVEATGKDLLSGVVSQRTEQLTWCTEVKQLGEGGREDGRERGREERREGVSE